MVIVMAGSLVGTAGVVLGLVLLDLGLLAALGLWAASGPASLLVWAAASALSALLRPAAPDNADRSAGDDFAPAG